MAAAAADEKSENGSSGFSAPSGGGNKLVMLLTGVNLLVTIGMVAILFISFQRSKHTPTIDQIDAKVNSTATESSKEGKEGEKKEGEGTTKKSADYGKMVTLEQFTVNLSTPGSVAPKFVRVNISLEVPNDDAETEVNSKMPQVRNAIIDLFNSKRPADLANAEGRDYLKEEIRNALNGFLVNGKIKGVYFTNFALAG